MNRIRFGWSKLPPSSFRAITTSVQVIDTCCISQSALLPISVADCAPALLAATAGLLLLLLLLLSLAELPSIVDTTWSATRLAPGCIVLPTATCWVCCACCSKGGCLLITTYLFPLTSLVVDIKL
eukprot:GHUV01030521.1.p1 GENE.GHUV01030521.1~~GHUV01030521.1.p1  ORF type:complete len:125 (+),score=25.53 GHUV01030521.1:78-452(+)